MQIRPPLATDAREIVAMGQELFAQSAYWKGSAPLHSKYVTEAISASLVAPDSFPGFILDPGDGTLAGFMLLWVAPNYFTGELWMDEKVLYIRERWRSFRVMRQLILHVEQWAKDHGVVHLEMSNASTKDPRLGALYQRMGYEVSNICYAKRFDHG